VRECVTWREAMALVIRLLAADGDVTFALYDLS
jgi:hypothetical protein